MKFIISRFNHNMDWIKDYKADIVLYDRSDAPHIYTPQGLKNLGIETVHIVPNVGSDIYDKLTFIIDNYEDLPEVAVYTKANLFQFISKEEFDQVKNNKKFTPLLTQKHKTYMPVCFYSDDGMYNEINNRWYLNEYKCKHLGRADELLNLLGLTGREYLKFAPGSNYILSKENILKHNKEFYIKLRSYLEHDRYPGEAQIMERGLYYLWS